MPKIKCPYCDSATKKFGKTEAGSQRWKCRSCGATFTHRIDNAAKLLAAFLGWLLSHKRQSDMPGGGRTFRRKCARFWEVWPITPVTGEIHRCVFADGIYLVRDLVVLIACTEERVIGWYLARSESSRSWAALMSKVAPPDVVVTDGGGAALRRRARGCGPRPACKGASSMPFAR